MGHWLQGRFLVERGLRRIFGKASHALSVNFFGLENRGVISVSRWSVELWRDRPVAVRISESDLRLVILLLLIASFAGDSGHFHRDDFGLLLCRV